MLKKFNETHYTDTYSEKFVLYIKKLKKFFKTNDISHYSIHFTNKRPDPINKSFNPNPNHYDPIGLYTYPAKYVLNNPSDINYGKDFRYLILIKYKSKHTLLLKNIINKYECINVLRLLGFSLSDIDNYIDVLINKKYNYWFSGINKWGKIFFFIIQHDMSIIIDDTKEKIFDRYRLRTQLEQNKILSKKYDAIIDDNQNDKDAIINNREPQQICFLKRSAFEYVDIEYLNNTNQPKIDRIDYENRHLNKIAATISSIIDDKIISRRSEWSDYIFYTKKGYTISITREFKKGYTDNKYFGQKKHKEFKESDQYILRFRVSTNIGELVYAASDEKLSKVYEKMKEEWEYFKERNIINPNWVFMSLDIYNKIKKEKKEKYLKEEKEKEFQLIKKRIPSFLERIKNYIKNNNLDINLDINLDDYNDEDWNNIISIYKNLEYFINIFNNLFKKFKNKEEMIKYFTDKRDDPELFEYFYGTNKELANKFIDIYTHYINKIGDELIRTKNTSLVYMFESRIYDFQTFIISLF